MKKHLIILLLVITSYAGFSKESSLIISSNAGESKLECRKINFGNKAATVVLKNGEKMTVPVNSISSYTLNGKEFTKKPLFINNRPSGKTRFMELVKSRGDLSLYRMEIPESTASETLETVVLGQHGKLFLYFLYKGDNIYLKMDERTLPNALIFFGLPYAS
jgi:hypothetical protein